METRCRYGVLFALPLLAGCQSFAPEAADPSADRTPDALFPTPDRGMTLRARTPDDDEPMTLKDMLIEFSEASGENLVWGQEDDALLRSTIVPLHHELVVEPAALYEVVEVVLRANDFALTDLRRSEPRLLMVTSTASSRRGVPKEYARRVPEADLHRYAGHPALMITTTLQLEHLDVMILRDAMRSLTTDPNTLVVLTIPASNSVVLTGFVPRVIDLVQMLRQLDADAESPPLLEPAEAAGDGG